MENITAIYSDYLDVVDSIGEDKIKESYLTWYAEFEKFAKILNYVDDIKLDEKVLMHAVCDAYADIARLKDFHNIINENGAKTLAYRCSWFLRRKPISVKTPNSTEEYVYINEKFVYTVLLGYLIDEEIDLKSSNHKNIKALSNYCDTILYYLKYRTCTPQILEIIILSFKAGAIYQKILE